MIGRRAFVAATLLALAACASVAPPSARPDIYVMRHLHTPVGASDPDLTLQGSLHAAALSATFNRTNCPHAIYVSDTKRARQTAAPLATRYGIHPKTYSPANPAGLVEAVRAERGPVLVVGHSNTVPDLIARFGGQRPADLTHKDFGDLWQIDRATGATTHRRILP